MYNSKDLLEKFSGLIGFLPSSDPSYPVLSDELLQSLSGIYIQTTHPLCSVENIFNTGPEFSKYLYPAYDNASSYKKGNVVTYAGEKYYASLDIAGAGIVPGALNSLWVKGDGFSAWLRKQYDSGVQRVFSDLIRMKKLDANTKQLIDSLVLFDGIGRYADKILKQGRFVGLSIKVNDQEGLTAAISQLGMQISGDATVPIYLFHSSQSTFIKKFEVTFDKNGSFQWFTVPDLILSYLGDYSTEGQFYLGYYEDDLPDGVQAVNRVSTWGISPCITCSDWNLRAYNKWSKHFNINGFYIPSSKVEANHDDMFDEQYLEYTPTTNFGFNLKVSVSCDLTQFYVGNKLSLSDAVAMGICVKLLEQIGYTTRLSSVADQTKMLAFKDLSIEDKDSFYNRYLNELKAVSLDFSGMSSDCMPCNSTKGIKMGAV